MKMYSTQYPVALFSDAYLRLTKEGYETSQIPYWRLADSTLINRPIKMERHSELADVISQPYYRVDFTFYTDADHTVRSPYRSAHKDLEGYAHRDSSTYAATHDQWGIMLGALLDVATEPVRLTGIYDPLRKGAPTQRWGLHKGEPYATSKALFTHVTVMGYTAAARADGGVDLGCTRHRWVTRGQWGDPTCDRCGRQYRWAG